MLSSVLNGIGVIIIIFCRYTVKCGGAWRSTFLERQFWRRETTGKRDRIISWTAWNSNERPNTGDYKIMTVVFTFGCASISFVLRKSTEDEVHCDEFAMRRSCVLECSFTADRLLARRIPADCLREPFYRSPSRPRDAETARSRSASGYVKWRMRYRLERYEA